VNDEEPTHPGRQFLCNQCFRPVYAHHEKCLVALLEFHKSLSKLQRALDLAIGAARRGAVLHWLGVLP
jgi:hypothetical protein